MKVYKAINNNIVSAFDDDNREVVVIGKGIGYKVASGTRIPREKIDKIYVMSSQDNMDRLKVLFASLPTEYIEITDEILTYAKKQLQKPLNEGAYFTLADHIGFAVTRFKQGMKFQNVLLAEVRRFYPQEYDIGLHALLLMEEQLQVTMPEDEAASIALHIFNAEYDISISDAFHATQLLNNILDLVYQMTGCRVDGGDYYGERFITHLKFLAQRVIKAEPLPEQKEGLFEELLEKSLVERECAQAIASYILQEHQYKLSKDEIFYLIIHLKRI